MKLINLIGNRFGKLIVLSKSKIKKNTKPCWICQCDCGNITLVRGINLRSGNTKSCGCLQIEETGKRFTKHGFCKHRLYSIWNSILQRCYNINDNNYLKYGGRGILVCDRWKKSFETFVKDMGERPDGTSIDRINNNGDYCKENCRWATKETQENNKRNNRYIEYNGEKLTIIQWSRKYNIPYKRLLTRFRSNWPIDKALTLSNCQGRKDIKKL